MNAVPAVVLMQEGAPPAGDLSFLLVMGVIFLIFYVLVIRPQSKKQREHEEALKAIEKGDEVVTMGGLHGKVTGTSDEVLTVELGVLKSGDRMRVKVQRARIDSVVKAGKGGEGS